MDHSIDTAVPASGEQYVLRDGGYVAHIASIGASVRGLTHEGRDLIVPFDADEVRPVYRGAMLAPWPNRVVGGSYAWAGEAQQLPLNEVARSHALHGLVAWSRFAPVAQTESEVTLVAVIEPQQGYPYRVKVVVHFAVTEAGLSTQVSATNIGGGRAPFGVAPHPYLVAGEGLVDDWRLELPADVVMTVTEDRLIPVGLVPVHEGAFDFRAARPIADTFIDHAFTGLSRTDGRATVRLTTPAGAGVGMSWGAECGWVQVHTADNPVLPASHRAGLAVEPMTCPPDAFNSGTDLITLDAGESTTAEWVIFAI